MSNIVSYQTAMIAALDARLTYELSKNVDTRFDKHIKALRDSVSREAIASVMLASNVDAEYINRAERSNNRYNIYAAQKVDNLARFLCASVALNHFTLAIFKSALALEANEMKLTHKDAVSASSAECKHSDKKREAIIKSQRYAKHVAANTASTQSSSSINALQTMNVLREMRDDANVVCYVLNRDAHATQEIARKLELAL